MITEFSFLDNLFPQISKKRWKKWWVTCSVCSVCTGWLDSVCTGWAPVETSACSGRSASRDGKWPGPNSQLGRGMNIHTQKIIQKCTDVNLCPRFTESNFGYKISIFVPPSVLYFVVQNHLTFCWRQGFYFIATFSLILNEWQPAPLDIKSE